jgi:small GTP-binding protein
MNSTLVAPLLTPTTITYVLLGSSNVGKTHLLNRFLESGKNPTHTVPTIINHKHVYKGKIPILFDIWDTSGRANFWFLRQGAVQKADVILLCFNLNDFQSFVDLEDIWLPEMKTRQPKPTWYLIGCKAELIHEVSDEQIQRFIQKHNVSYIPTSSVCDFNIQKCFDEPYHLFFPEPKIIPNNISFCCFQ